jgi:hypothetical protein
MKVSAFNPMQPENLAKAPRCGARTRVGAPCRSPAVGGSERCRMHGGRGSGAPAGNANRRKHGLRSRRIRAIARYLRATRGGILAGLPEEAAREQPESLSHLGRGRDPRPKVVGG